jgi:alkylation response protein AidB-like acyl-CoA dehydrogenase
VEWNLSPEQDAYQEAFRGWLSDVAPPDAVRRWLDAGDAAAFEKLFADGGRGGVGLPEELGGQGGELVELALTAEELARVAAPSAGWLETVLAVPALALAGHRDLAELALAGETAAYLIPAEYVPDEAPPLSVDETGAISGSVPRVLAGGTAVRFVVPTISPDTGDGPELRLVEAGAPEVTRTGRKLLDRSRSVADVTLDRAPSRRLELGDPAEVLRSAVYFAAASVDAGGPDAFLHAAAVKAQVTAEGARTADSALTLHGAIGYTWEYDLQLFYKRARLDEKLLGTPAQWNERIAAGLALV